jgi:putative membrane protein
VHVLPDTFKPGAFSLLEKRSSASREHSSHTIPGSIYGTMVAAYTFIPLPLEKCAVIIMNKELVLREYLAIERTKLVNESTLLAYIRTGLYFLVAGSTIGQLVQSMFWQITGVPLVIIGFSIMLLGLFRYMRLRKVIEESRKNIGESSEGFIKAARGE